MTDSKQGATNAANSGAAPFANRLFVALGPVVRITFAEQWGSETEPTFRTAVAMGHQDAIQLKNILVGLLAGVEKQLAAAQANVSGTADRTSDAASPTRLIGEGIIEQLIGQTSALFSVREPASLFGTSRNGRALRQKPAGHPSGGVYLSGALAARSMGRTEPTGSFITIGVVVSMSSVGASEVVWLSECSHKPLANPGDRRCDPTAPQTTAIYENLLRPTFLVGVNREKMLETTSSYLKAFDIVGPSGVAATYSM